MSDIATETIEPDIDSGLPPLRTIIHERAERLTRWFRPMTDDPFDLQRFIAAQEPVFDRVIAELGDGRKRSHWMWFVFPQIAGLGQSPMARKYAIFALAEAEAYLSHPILGPRLVDCARLVNRVEGRSANDILGYPDDLKFQSSMTLFARAEPDNPLFAQALDKYFGGVRDPGTLNRLN